MGLLDELRALLGQAQAPLRSAAEGVVQNAVQPAFNTAMDVADTPGSFLRASGSALGNQLRGDDGSDLARRAFAGILDPSQRVSGGEVNTNTGMGNSAVGDFATGVLTDPFAATGVARGLAAGGRLAGRGLGALGRSLAGESGNVARSVADEGARTLRAPGLGTYTTDAAGQTTYQAPQAISGGNRFGPGGAQIFSEGSTPMAESEMWRGPNVYRARQSLPTPGSLSTDMGTASGDNGNVANLLPLRRQFTHVAIDSSPEGGLVIGNRTGGMSALEPGQTAGGRSRQVMRGAYDSASRIANGEAAAEYNIPYRTATTVDGAPRGDVREELMHGIMERARANNNSSGLNLLPRMANRMQLSGSPLMQALGVGAEEMAAHGARSRGMMGQGREMARFLLNPLEGYASQYGEVSPFVANLYRSRALPGAAAGAAGLGAGVAGATAANVFGE